METEINARMCEMRYGIHRYFHSPELLISIIHNLDIFTPALLRHLDARHHFFVILGYNADHLPDPFELSRQMLEQTLSQISSEFPLRNIFMMCNTSNQVPRALAAGFSAGYINHNCWLDYEIFDIRGGTEREFTAVINACPARWKRIYLAADVPRLAYIRGNLYDSAARWDDSALRTAYQNAYLLSPREVAAVLNRCSVGLCLSGHTGQQDTQGYCEGAMQASSEYLLCGLPVVSTPSQGGRDVWYDDGNSLLVEPDRCAVFLGCIEAVSRLESGRFDPARIRAEHIKLSERFRTTFIEATAVLLAAAGISLDARSYFDTRYVHKMIRWPKDELTTHEIVECLRRERNPATKKQI